MGIEALGLSDGVRPGQVAKFTFTGQVQAFALGLWAFSLTYESKDHYVQNFSIKMLPTQTEDAAVVGNVVSAKVNARLQDSSGNTLGVDDCIIYPACVAMVDTFDPSTVLTNVTGIGNGSSTPITLPGSSGFSALASFLSGFDLGYSDGDHQVLGASAGCGINNNQSQGMISGSASLYDASGNNANTATVDAGVIVSTDASPGYAIIPVTNQTSGPIPIQFSSLPSVRGVCCLITSWQVQYDAVHNVRNFSIGTWGYPQIQGNTVTLPNLNARVSDASGNTQDDAKSSASVLVVAFH